MLTDMSHSRPLLSTKPLALRDFLGGLILFISVTIFSPHHFGWCERNAFNACRKKGALSGPWRMVRFPPGILIWCNNSYSLP